MTRAKRVAIASCKAYPKLLDDDQHFVAPLRAVDIDIEVLVWNDPKSAWAEFDAVVIRSTWDYYLQIDSFRTWLHGLQTSGIRVLNDVNTLLNNIDKRYLQNLEAKGVATIPTLWMEPNDTRNIASVLNDVPWMELVVKPAISAGAYRTLRCTRQALLADDSGLREILQSTHALLQPFMSEIVDVGEYSFLFFGETFSHSVLKSAATGDFRVQWTHGGSQVKSEPDPEILAQVQEVMRCLPPAKDRLYSRIDGIVRDGRFLLVEAELIEPYLFFGQSEAAGLLFAKTLAGFLSP